MALGETAFNLLENLSEIPAETQRINGFDRLNMFGIIRMIETAIINIDRIQLLWEVLSAHLECFANCKYSQLRSLAVDGITCLVINTFLSKAHSTKSSRDLKDKRWINDEWQVMMLNSLQNCLKSGHLETAYTMIHNLPSVIIVYLPYI